MTITRESKAVLEPRDVQLRDFEDVGGGELRSAHAQGNAALTFRSPEPGFRGILHGMELTYLELVAIIVLGVLILGQLFAVLGRIFALKWPRLGEARIRGGSDLKGMAQTLQLPPGTPSVSAQPLLESAPIIAASSPTMAPAAPTSKPPMPPTVDPATSLPAPPRLPGVEPPR